MTSIHALVLYDSPTARQKAAEALQLAADVAAFERKGGKIQRLGNTPINRSTISRRKGIEGGANERIAAKKEKRT
ncbi:hypothetical protein [Stenotrophomonas sp. BIGb0135]|uniref:hypothetical protein n=1 Tax=Stenotrophomonas sp. BIGb0135 TaxID=2940620 RepID=UPI002168F2E4|nr:hypothetical protein [Stenotrophomonas sp. BIGb0135]MCS4234463.1 hypothetical protein [Stenotrophomonas sp. BIGb0135]